MAARRSLIRSKEDNGSTERFAYASLYPTPAIRLRPPDLNPRAQGSYPCRAVDMVGGGEIRPLPETRQARPAHDRLAGRGHSQPHREGRVTHGEAV